MENEFILLLAADADAIFVEAIEKREDISPADKERAKKEYGDVKFADEKNKKYPIDTKEHVQAAIRYFGMPKNYEKYSSEERATIRGKLRAAAKKFGVEYAEENKSEGSDDPITETPKSVKEQKEMEDKDKKEEGREELPMKGEADELKARIAELENALKAKEELIAAKDAELAEEKKKKEDAEKAKGEADTKACDMEKKASDMEAKANGFESKIKDMLLASKYEGDELTEVREKVKDWRIDQIEVLASTAGRATPRKPEVPTSPMPSGGNAAQTPAKKKIVLE